MPINPGNQGLNKSSVIESNVGKRMKMPKPAFIVNVERSAVANLPSAYVCTIWKIGTHSNEYKNKFHKNHKCPRAMILPNNGTQKMKDVKKT